MAPAKTLQLPPGSGALLSPRERFITDLKNPSIKHVGVPHREIRAAAQRMASYAPLIDTTIEERKIISHFAMLGMEEHWKDLSENLGKLRDGEWKLRNPATGVLGKATKEQVEAIFTVWEASIIKAFCTCPGNECKKTPGNSMKNRTLSEMLAEDGLDARSAANAALRAKKGKIRILDAGCGDAMGLHELKQEMGSKIETHGLSILEETRAPVDYSYHMSAELMPAGFKGMFDLEISDNALQYVSLPHIMIANIAESLASKGKAVVNWMESQFEIMYKTNVSSSGIYDYYGKYLRGVVSGTSATVIRNGRRVEGKLLLDGPEYNQMHKIAQAIEYRDLNRNQALAYCIELSIINAMPEYHLTAERYTETCMGRLPTLVTIERA